MNMLDSHQQHALASPTRATFAISNTRPSPRTRSSSSIRNRRLCRKWLSLRDNMSSCLNLHRPARAASNSSSAGTPASPVDLGSPSGSQQKEEHPQDENEAPVVFEIGMPYDLKHDVHIHYNFKEARFEGVPDNFAEFLASANGLLDKKGNAATLSASLSSMTKPSQRVKRSRTTSSSTTATNNNNNNNDNCSPHSNSNNNDSNDAAGTMDPQLLLNQHFKVHFRQVPRLAVLGYEDRVPAVLLMLQKHFVAKQGYLLPHIFRESPNKSDRDQAMREINTGTFSGATHDVRVLADLIKLWFRELPVPIFHEIRSDQMEKIVKMGGVNVADEVIGMLGPLEKCIVMWLADLLAHVAEYQDQNHMGVDQLAIIIAPNLVRIETENPMLAVALSKAAVDLFRSVLRARFQYRRQLHERSAAARGVVDTELASGGPAAEEEEEQTICTCSSVA